MKTKFQINPSNEFLMDYCYVNTWVTNEFTVQLLPKGNYIERIEFFFLKRKFNKLIKKLDSHILKKSLLNFDRLLGILLKQNDGIWDLILYSIAIRTFANWKAHKTQLKKEVQFGVILELYLDFIKENHGNDIRIIKNQSDILKIEAKIELAMAGISIQNNGSASY